MSHTYTNNLVHETSPYLLQHAHNPVDWYPWGEKALKKARDENKLLVISIGYSSCHWCHVMEKESFEDREVAGAMNSDYVSIKIDREERPDIDQVYMNAAYLVTGSGGWPLNVIALPDGRPVYAGTYFPKENWLKLLEHFASLFKTQPELLRDQAGKITQGLADADNLPSFIQPVTFDTAEIDSFTSSLLNNTDFDKGGTLGAPKFPMPGIYDYLLQYQALRKKDIALEAVHTTLTRMALGGIYDHIGGGFARYAVDDRWLVPHFEKMLYDNAQLISLYSRAYQQSKNPLYRQVVYESTDFIHREMTSPRGAFYSALDADSEGVEGKFYTWTKQEAEEVLKEDAALFSSYFNIVEEGNWERGLNILHINDLDEEFMVSKKLKKMKALMLKARSERERPLLDNKVLASWNALMLNAYIDAYRVFDDKVFRDRALASARFLRTMMIQDDYSILRNYMNDQACINGFLDDYAFTIAAFINLYQATFEEVWLHIAQRLAEYALDHFSDASSPLFFYTSDEDTPLIMRNKELSDNVIPSSNSQMAKNLFFLGTFFEKRNYIVRASELLTVMKEKVLRHPSFHANWGSLMLWLSYPPYEVVITGSDSLERRAEFDRHHLPHVVFAGGVKEGSLDLLKHRFLADQTMIYVCKDKSCQLPVTTVRGALKQLGG